MNQLRCVVALCLLFPVVAFSNVDTRERIHPGPVVYQEKSLYRNLLVRESDAYRCMAFGRIHSYQSCISKAAPLKLALMYTKGLISSLYLRPDARKVLIIGMGGGVLPRTLRDIDPSMEIDTVELDPAVIRVAKDYFGYREDGSSQAYVDDGRIFVRKQIRAGKTYDIVMIDAFDKDSIPEHMLTQEFLQQVRQILTPGGVVASNSASRGELPVYETATYQSVFGAIYHLDFDTGNRIILATRGELPDQPRIEAQGRLLDSAFARYGVESSMILALLTRAPEASADIVLTDQFSPSNLLLMRYQR